MRRSHHALLFGLAIGTAAFSTIMVAAPSAQAWTYKALYSFCAEANCVDGGLPFHLSIDPSGNLLGLTTYGGRRGAGTLFRLSPHAHGTQWHYNVLFSPPSGGMSPIIMDTAGNVYGTTFGAGKYGYGSIFELVRPGADARWHYKTLYSFCKAEMPACLDGRYTQAGLTYAGQTTGAPYDGASPLFGTAQDGGASLGGVAFKLHTNDAGKWRYKVLYTFCSAANCDDGANPGRDGLIADTSGNLFGSTRTRGVHGQGTVFALDAKRNGREWREHTLYEFCSRANCADGAWGEGGLLLDASGDRIGVTANGGNSCTYNPAGCGVLFEEAASGGPGKYRVLHVFCSQSNCTDGNDPLPSVIANSSGAFFGTTSSGGGNTIDQQGEGGGVVYSYDGSFQVLYAFCAQANCTDGEYPAAGLVTDSSGNLFGTTNMGGQYGYGVVFEISP